MAEKPKAEEKVEVPLKLLTEMQEQLASQEKRIADSELKAAGLAEIINQADTTDAPKLRERNTKEPKFHTVRLRKYPKAGGDELHYVKGWTNKGAYQEVDRTGVSPQIVDFIDIIYLGDETTKEGKIKAEKVRLLDFLNKGQQVHCKIIETKNEPVKIPTGEEIQVVTFDPQHGLTTTGDLIDGYVVQSNIKFKINVPGHGETWIDSEFVNA
jgi:hypothetical protein